MTGLFEFLDRFKDLLCDLLSELRLRSFDASSCRSLPLTILSLVFRFLETFLDLVCAVELGGLFSVFYDRVFEPSPPR